MSPVVCRSQTAASWDEIASDVLDSRPLTRDDCLAVLDSPDDELLSLLSATFRVRRHHFGLKVHLYYLQNAKSGLCPEDCGYCSQSAVSDAPIPRYSFLNEQKLLEGARQAHQSRARTYCIVASGRGPSDREIEHVAAVVEKIKAEFGLHICCCLGLLRPEQANRLKAAGVDRINHNLNPNRPPRRSVSWSSKESTRHKTPRTRPIDARSSAAGGATTITGAPSSTSKRGARAR